MTTPRPDTTPPRQKKAGTLLIVDDAPENLAVLECLLEVDYTVLTAESGAQALLMAAEQVPDLILLDVMMPVMDGFAVAETLRSDPQLHGIPIVFLTGLSDTKDQLRGLELGAVDFLVKPFDLTILGKRVANVIERERLRAEAVEHEALMRHLLFQQTDAHNTLESAFNASNDALIVTNQNFKILRVNNNAYPLFGAETEQMVGTLFGDCQITDEHEQPVNLEDIVARDAPQDYTLCTPQGNCLSVSITGRSFSGQNGTLNFLFSLQDISKRLALEKEKRQTNKLLHEALLELGMQKEALDAHALVSITDAQGIITYANEKFCHTAGYTVDEIVGQSHRLIKSGEHPPRFYAELWQTISAGKTWHGEIANRAKDGHLYWVESTIVPWLDGNGIPYQYVAIRTDISDRRRAEQELALSRARELEIGAAIQKRLLFGKPPSNLEGLSVACFSEASQGVDGDFYTFTQLNASCFEVLTGDVMGKGVAAALIAAAIKTTYRTVFLELLAKKGGKTQPSPQEIINAVHQAMTPELIDLSSFVTLSLMRVDRQAKTVTWVNAGHTPTLLARGTQPKIIELIGDNLPLGVLEQEHYVEQITPVEIGDTLLFYSDGISESVNAENIPYGTERIQQILRQGQQGHAYSSIILNSLRSDIHDFTQFTSGGDDRTAVVVQLRAVRDTSRGSITQRRMPHHLDLPRQLNKLEVLRQQIAALAIDQPEEFTQMLILAAFEATTNIIRHTPEKLSDAPITAVLCRNEHELSIELTYEGPLFKPSGPPTPDFSGNAEGGFGLYIIENAVDRVDYGSPLPGISSIRLVKNIPLPP